MLVELITQIVTNFLEITGYPALIVLMAMESMIFPVPSEAVMPFAGFLIAEGKMSWFLAIFFSTLGTLIGSLISYAMGYYGGNKFVKHFGRYFLLDEKALVWTEHWFSKHGSKTIFISRFIPVVRHLISIPAGIGKMPLKKFITYTFLGGVIWNSFLLYTGVLLQEKWALVQQYSHSIDIAIIIIFILAVIWFIWRHIVKNRK
jgi:membrane protein DedA with SNARE-associated domain